MARAGLVVRLVGAYTSRLAAEAEEAVNGRLALDFERVAAWLFVG